MAPRRTNTASSPAARSCSPATVRWCSTPTAVVLRRPPLDQAPGHESVDDGGDRGPGDVEAAGEGRGRRGVVLGQEDEHPVLGEREVDAAEGDLGRLGQAGQGADPVDGDSGR